MTGTVPIETPWRVPVQLAMRAASELTVKLTSDKWARALLPCPEPHSRCNNDVLRLTMSNDSPRPPVITTDAHCIMVTGEPAVPSADLHSQTRWAASVTALEVPVTE